MEKYETQNGRRPDLEQQPVNYPAGYIGTRIFPISHSVSKEKAGSFRYQLVQSDVAAQTSRGALVAPTATAIANAVKAYTCAGYEKRFGIPWDEVQQDYLDVIAADRVGGMMSKRSVMRAFEDVAYATLMDSTGYSAATVLTANSELAILQKAALSCKRITGKLALVASQSWYLDFVNRSTVVAGLTAIWGINAVSMLSQAILSKQTDVVKQLLATIIAVEEILIGDDEHWYTGAYTDAAALVMLPQVSDPSIPFYKENPVYGVTKWYLPEPTKPEFPFELRSFSDPNTKANYYDATGWFNVLQLNAAGKKLVKLAGGIFATTTTTAATTTTTTTAG